jgi:hypothetical protein
MAWNSDKLNAGDDGRNVFLTKIDCALVDHWARRYEAQARVRWVSTAGGSCLLDPGDMMLTSGWEKEDVVWAVSSLMPGASRDAHQIARLAASRTAQEYDEIYQTLSGYGYPEQSLGSIPRAG